MTKFVENLEGFFEPAMLASASPEWAGAMWVGLIDEESPLMLNRGGVSVAAAEGYSSARLLVRKGGRVRGLLDVDLQDGRLDLDDLRERIAGLPGADAPPAHPEPLSVTVVICTRNRADLLATALASVLASDYVDLDVIVVDNASTTDATATLVATVDDPRVHLVIEPRAGLSRARNHGLRRATGDIVAFTDDDVVVDPQWVSRLVDGFARDVNVACVTGLVPSGELRTPTQAYFDERVSWAKSCRGRVFSLRTPPADVPMFPFLVGVYGTGANLALRREAAFALGGFDEALGVGSPTCGGEDIDMFVRVLQGGYALAYEPSAIVWHRHRADAAALAHQAVGYGVGLGAWLTKVALDPSLVMLAMRQLPRAIARIRALGDSARTASDEALEPDLQEALSTIGRTERRAVLSGPVRYLSARAKGASARPLAGVTPARTEERVYNAVAHNDEGVDVHADANEARRRMRRIAGLQIPFSTRSRFTALALVSVIAGLLAQVPALPPGAKVLLLGAFVLVGPGSAISIRLPAIGVPAPVLIPVLGVTVVVLATTAAAFAGWWAPSVLLAVFAACIAIAAAPTTAELVREARS